jgi:hypothetical protein
MLENIRAETLAKAFIFKKKKTTQHFNVEEVIILQTRKQTIFIFYDEALVCQNCLFRVPPLLFDHLQTA